MFCMRIVNISRKKIRASHPENHNSEVLGADLLGENGRRCENCLSQQRGALIPEKQPPCKVVWLQMYQTASAQHVFWSERLTVIKLYIQLNLMRQ